MSGDVKLGVIILAHSRADRARQVAQYMNNHGCVVHVHFDTATGLPKDVNFDGISVSSKFKSVWGGFGLVDATLSSVGQLLAQHPDLTHITLMSEACLPIRPISDLKAHLAAHPETDFITCKELDGEDWIGDGLSQERATLFHPFSYRTQRGLFEASVWLQRLLNMRRKVPFGLKLCVGDQWWCLRTSTLRQIMAHTAFDPMVRFMRKAWIPDELFFQTLISALPEARMRPSLTYAEFDRHGKPYVFYDDHRDLLETAPGFFARKIWPDADGLYDHFGSVADTPFANNEFSMRNLASPSRRHFTNMGQAVDVRSRIYRLADRPFVVFMGFDVVKPDFSEFLKTHAQVEILQNVFSRKVRPSQGQIVPGNTVVSSRLLHHNPHAHLANIIASAPQSKIALSMNPGDHHGVWSTLIRTATARIIFLEDHWTGRLRPGDSALRADRLKSAYDKFLDPNLFKLARAKFRTIPMKHFLEDPSVALKAAEFETDAPRKLSGVDLG